MKTIYLIGIGPGDPEHLTLKAMAAMRKVEVFFVLNKEGRGKDELEQARLAILKTVRPEGGYRIAFAKSPSRGQSEHGYGEDVREWHAARAEIVKRWISEELSAEGIGAFLVWGDPALYDSTMRVLDQIKAGGDMSFDYEVIPGVSSIQALAARHRVPLNEIGGAITVTTPRELKRHGEIENAVVMLDSTDGFADFLGRGLQIYWGAYVGTPDEILIAGPLDAVCSEIRRVAAEARARKGWIMHSYILRKAIAPPDGQT